MNRTVVGFIIGVFVALQSFAQSKITNVGFRITEVRKSPTGYIVTIPYGTDVGIQHGSGSVWGIARKELADHVKSLGDAAISQLTAATTIVEVTTSEVILAGDLLFLNTEVPEYQSPYHYLVGYGIMHVDDAGKPLYDVSEVLLKDSPRLRTEKFIVMQNLIRSAGDRLAEKKDKQKVKAGPDAGKLLSDVLKSVDTLKVWTYLYLKSSDWSANMGQTFTLSDDFTQYALEGDVISNDLLWETITGATEDEIASVYNSYKRRITIQMLSDWIEKSRVLAHEGDYERAGLYLGHLITMSRLHGDQSLEALAANYKALILYLQEQYAEAFKLFNSVADLYQKLGDKAKLANAYYYMGYCYNLSKDPDQAITYHSKSRDLRSDVVKADPTNETAWRDLYLSQTALGEIFQNNNRFQESISPYEEALKIATRLKDTKLEGSCKWNLGYIYGDGLNKTQQAITYYREATDAYWESGDTLSTIKLLRNTALQYNVLKNYEESFKLGNRAADLAKVFPDKATRALVGYLLALTFHEQGNLQEAIRRYEIAEKLYADVPDANEVIQAKKKVAAIYTQLGLHEKAIRKHEERLAFVPENPSGQADAYWEMAYATGENLKKHKEAITLYEKCRDIYISLKDTTNLNTIYANVAYHHRMLGDSIKCYQNHHAGIAVAEKFSDRTSLAYAYDKAARSYGHFNNQSAAASYFKKSIALYNGAGEMAKVAAVMEGYAESLKQNKKFEEAALMYKDASIKYGEAGDKPNEAESYWDYAYTLGNDLSRYEPAIENYQIAYRMYMAIPDSVNASVMLSNVGQTYWSLLNYDKAIEYHRKAIEIASRSKNMKQVAKSWSKLATLYTESNNPVSSFEALKNTVAALEVLKDSIELADNYNEIARNYIKAKSYPEGFANFEKALAIRKARKDEAATASTLFDIAAAYYDKTDFKKSEAYYLQAYNMKKKLKDREGEVYTLANLALIAQSINADYKKSEQYLTEAMKIANEIKDDYILAYCYSRLKGLYRSVGRSAEADAASNKSLELYKKLGRWKDVATTLNDIGYDAHYVYGDIPRAMSYFDQAQAMADTLKDNFLQAGIYSSRASVFRETGEFEKALEMSKKGLKIYQDVDNNWGLAGTYIDLGNIYKQMSEYELSVRYQQKSDSLYQALGLEYARLAPLANLGENYVSQGNYQKGLDYYHQSFKIMKDHGDMNENLAIINACLGEAYFYLNDYPQADRWLKESLVVCDKVGAKRAKADNLGVMGRLKIEEKKYAEALKYLNEGLAISKASGMTIAYLNNLLLIGKAEVEQKHFEQAKSPLEECLKTSRAIGKRSTLWESLYLMGVLYKNSGDLQKSKEYLKESVTVIEQIRNKVSGGEEAQKLFSSDKNILKVYDVLIDVLLQLGETEEAMSYLQKNNEENLKAKFKSLDVKFENEDRKRAIDEERTMKAKLDGLEAQIAREKSLESSRQNVEKLKNLEGIKTIAESEYLKFINQQINVQPQLSRYFNNSVQPTQFRKVKKHIPADMALLSYLVGENQVYIFVATTDTVVAKIVTVSSDVINKNVNAVLNIGKNHMGSFSPLDLKVEEAERKELVNEVKQKDLYLKPLEELYHYLIAPVSQEIAGKKRLGIIPTGSLNYIPFQLLGKTLAANKFSLLANQYSIFYTSSTDMLFRLAQEDDKDINILAFGNPDKTLPSTELEVQDIKKLFPDATIFVRDEATEDKAKFAGEEFNVMHFATHGNLDYEDFSKSFLTMAGNPAKSEDGMLTLEELWGMDVMNHLNIVVLSACQTAVTKGSHENSPVSPASGFLQNGVKSVIATLWKVDDHATSVLISNFYKNLKTMDAVDALRTAQVSLSQEPKYSHPYYWAGIVLLGDWR